MTEEEFQRQAQEFVKRLKHYPQVGKRPFGYPKKEWWRSGVMALVGFLLQLPLWLNTDVERWSVLCSVWGAVLVSCAFTMRVVAFTSAASGAMDLWLAERIEALGTLPRDRNTAEADATDDRPGE